jgi:hypothetical protein
MYSIAAGAAGVSILALAQPADAEVVVTPKNLTVVPGAPVYIEMTGEGRADFELVAQSFFSRTLEVTPLPGGAVVGGSFLKWASRLGPGAIVGPLAPFTGGGVLLYRTHWYTLCASNYCHTIFVSSGYWGADGSTAYLGVKFPIAGRIHYGWIRLAVTNWYPVTAHITAYAYETEPDTPLLVPPVPSDETDNDTKQEDQNISKASVGGPSLGMLALGAHGLPVWRREETLAY